MSFVCHMLRFAGISIMALFLIPLLPGSGELSGQTYPEELYDALSWRNIGPARGGRSTAVAGSRARPLEYYFGATGGGLWKTTDAGQTWRPITDGQIGSASVGAVQVCEADPDVVYIGTGETQLRGNIQQGDGVYRSDDGGETWEHLGLEEAQNFSRIRIHPDDCDTAWLAAFGKHSASNPERGIFKTTDGGESWDKVLYRDERTGGVDISVDATDPDVLYAALWEAYRRSWEMSSGGPGSGLFKSTDGGETWTEISQNEGLPREGPLGKIGVAVSPADPDRVYAILEHETEGGVYRSDDGGESWTYTNDERNLRQRAFYYTRIYADPLDADVSYVLNTGFYKSTDAGETFDTRIRVPHGDNHDLWIAPDDSDRMINANDGGANVSWNGGDTWTHQNYSTAQFYRVMTTDHEPYHICGAQQDNSTACVPSRDWSHLSRYAGGEEFLYAVGGCESGHIAQDPEDLDVFYAGCYGGQLSRYDHETGQRRAINVWPENPMGHAPETIRERFQWNFPIVFSHHDPDALYVASQHVWKSTNEGQSFERISPDLTRAVDSTMTASGGPITKDETGVETFATIFALAPSYHDGDVIWAGSDDGLVHVTRNGGVGWEDVTPPDMPYLTRINTIEASPNTPGKAYVAGVRYLIEDDRAPYVWKTEDYGATWTRIDSGIAPDHFVRAVREDPHRPGMLYAATEETVYVSWDDGATWQPLSLDLPNLQVSDLVVEENDLVIATHGRSFWVMYDMKPLRELSPAVADADVHLFDPVDPVRDVDSGLGVYYYLAEDADEVTLEFLEEDGTLIQSYTGTAEEEEEEEEEPSFFGGGSPEPDTEAGSHRFTWNLRYPGYTDFEGRIFWAAGNFGPEIVPGRYLVRLTVDGSSQEQDFEVKLDPRLEDEVALADLQERFDFAMRVRDRVSEANEAVIRIRNIKGQVDDRLEEADRSEIETQGRLVNDRLTDVEGEIYQYRSRSGQDPLNFPIRLNNKLAALIGIVESAETRPTAQSYEVFDVLSRELETELERLQTIIERDVARLNELLRAEGMDPVETGELIS